ncbi:C-X-C motif chemokine 2-like [Oryzias melastigma]|uniref:C-X-C motif chemokine 2-like n=1 Tax=Oryzias melastigma TaxID=30732 RepID=UPI00168D12E4|nr:C-X-C motif chemokine 2-like [Oryzias melastigma]
MRLITQSIILLVCGLICHSAILKCRCLRTSQRVDESLIRTVEELPPRPYCAKDEIIVTLKDNKKVCLDPTHKFTKAVLASMKKNSGKPAKVRTTTATTTTTTAATSPSTSS